MANCNYRGLAPVYQQSESNTVGTSTSTHTYILTFTDLETGATAVVTATLPTGLADTTAAATYVASVYKASGKAKFDEQSFSTATNVLTTKARTPGRPFSLAYTAGTGTWGTVTPIEANSGPGDWSCPANYEENLAPASGDNIILWGGASPIYNTYQSGTTYGKLDTSTDWTGHTAKIVAAWTAVRQRGKGQLYLDMGTSNIAVTVDSTADLSNNALASVFYGTNLSSLTVTSGAVGLAPWAGLSTTCATITNNGGRIIIGSGVTATTIHNENGTLFLSAACTTLNSVKGTITTDGSGAITTWNQYQATCFPNSSGTITTMALKSVTAGLVDMNQVRTARTISTLNGAGKLNRDSTVVTITTNNALAELVTDSAIQSSQAIGP